MALSWHRPTSGLRAEPVALSRRGLLAAACGCCALASPFGGLARATVDPAPEHPLHARLDAAARAIEPRLIAWRRDIHQHPELGNQERRTAALAAAHLKALGFAVRERVAVTGLVATLRGCAGPGPGPGPCPVIGAQIVTARQTIQSRQVDANDASVLTVGVFRAGNRSNIIPDDASMAGTLRTYDERRRTFMMRRVKEIAEGIASSMDGSADVTWEPDGYPVTVNDAALTARMAPSLARVCGRDRLRLASRATASEDFSYFARAVPGFFFTVGINAPGADPRTTPSNHSPRFRVDEAGLLVGLRAMLHVEADFSGSTV
jgi:metal-dependent amidase/aminoacylase/carboxypeptidase family protein